MIDNDIENDDWNLWWDARVEAMECVLGKTENTVIHSVIPFDLGVTNGGGADVIFFRNHINGVGYATSEMIGRDDQSLNNLGNYELLIFHREESDWGPNIISRLSYYTCEAILNPGETMDLGTATPDGSTIHGFLYFDYGTFKVRGRQAGLLLCLGITAEELAVCRAGKLDRVIIALKEKGVYPFTELYRKSVL